MNLKTMTELSDEIQTNLFKQYKDMMTYVLFDKGTKEKKTNRENRIVKEILNYALNQGKVTNDFSEIFPITQLILPHQTIFENRENETIIKNIRVKLNKNNLILKTNYSIFQSEAIFHKNTLYSKAFTDTFFLNDQKITQNALNTFNIESNNYKKYYLELALNASKIELTTLYEQQIQTNNISLYDGLFSPIQFGTIYQLIQKIIQENITSINPNKTYFHMEEKYNPYPVLTISLKTNQTINIDLTEAPINSEKEFNHYVKNKIKEQIDNDIKESYMSTGTTLPELLAENEQYQNDEIDIFNAYDLVKKILTSEEYLEKQTSNIVKNEQLKKAKNDFYAIADSISN